MPKRHYGGYHDFVVNFDPDKDTHDDIFERIVYSLFVYPMKRKFPRVIFIGGDSGSGKSMAALKLQCIMAKTLGVDINEHVDAMNVYVPLEYPQKLKALLEDPKHKKAFSLALHEARVIINAKQWQGFVASAVANVNALSRSVKRLCFIIVSQFIRDITADVRYTLNYYITVKRSPHNGYSEIKIERVWKDDNDLEKPRLRKRGIRGFLRLPNGSYRGFIPKTIKLRMPPKEIADKFDELDTKAKQELIGIKMDAMIDELKAEFNVESKKIDSMVKYYSENIERVGMIGKRMRNGKYKIKPEIKSMHDMTPNQIKMFEAKFNKKLKEKKFVGDDLNG